MASEDLREYLEAARQRRVHEQDARKQEMAARHEARRRDFEARSEPLNVHVVRVLEGARADLAEAGAKLEEVFDLQRKPDVATGLLPSRIAYRDVPGCVALWANPVLRGAHQHRWALALDGRLSP